MVERSPVPALAPAVGGFDLYYFGIPFIPCYCSGHPFHPVLLQWASLSSRVTAVGIPFIPCYCSGDPFHPVLLQWHVKDPGHFPKKKKKMQMAGYIYTHIHPTYVASHKVTLLLPSAWLYSVHRTCAETEAVSCGPSHVRTKQRFRHLADIQDVPCESYSHSFRVAYH